MTLTPTGHVTRANHYQTLEKANGMIMFLPVDPLQYPLVCFVQGHRQLIQGTPNAGDRKSVV